MISKQQSKLINVAKVSIVVPIYGTESYLEKCLASILKQTFEDIEIICVDDKSPDRSAEIVRDFISLDSRVKLIQHDKNLGLGGARNTGIRNASSQYVMGIDSDDYIHPHMVQDLYRCATNFECDVVECGLSEVDELGKELSTYTPFRDPIDISRNTDIFSITRFAFWNKIFRRNLFLENNIWFPDKIYYEDLATMPRIFSRAVRIGYVGDVRYYYVQRRGSITNSIREKNILDYIKVLDILRQDMQSTGWYGGQIEYFRNTIKVNFDFIKKKIALSDDPYKMNLIRYADFIEKAYDEYAQVDSLPVFDAKIRAEVVLTGGAEKFPPPHRLGSSSKPLNISVLSRYDHSEAVNRLKIGALRTYLADRALFSGWGGVSQSTDGVLVNHLDSIEDCEHDFRKFRQNNRQIPIIAMVSDLYPRVAHQMKRFYDLIDAYAVPTVEMKNSMECFTEAKVAVIADPIDFLLDNSLRKVHVDKRPLDVIWFGYQESFEKSMLEFSPLLEYLHSVRRIRYHIVTNVAGFRRPEHALVHEYKPDAFVNLLPMFDVCVLSHAPNDFQIATYIKSENKAVLAINRGVPVLATRTPSYERLLSSLGLQEYLFGVRDELEAALVKMESPAKRNSYLAKSQDKILSRFAPKVIAEQWWDLFSSLKKS